MNKTIRVTNLFTGNEKVYAGVDAFRTNEKNARDVSVAGIIDMLADAYVSGRPTKTYEWMLGVAVA